MINTLIDSKNTTCVPDQTTMTLQPGSILTRNTPLATTSNVVKELQAKKDLTIINGNSVKNLTTSNGKTVNVS